MENKVFKMLTQMDKKADDKHAKVLYRLSRLDNRLDGVAKIFE